MTTSYVNNPKHSSSFSGNTKHSATPTNRAKSASVFTNGAKASTILNMYLRHGKEPSMGDLANYTFQSVVFMDGTILGNVTFDQFADIIWSNQNKN